MKNITLELDEKLLSEAGKIMDEECINLNLAIQMFLNRVIKEKTITFLFKKNQDNTKENDSVSADSPKLSNDEENTRNIIDELFSKDIDSDSDTHTSGYLTDVVKDDYKGDNSKTEEEPLDSVITEQKQAYSFNPYFQGNQIKPHMSKSIAIRRFLSMGFKISRNVTFASKNQSAYNYWANPEFGMLDVDWSLIFNDWINKKLYLFQIPAGSIAGDRLVPRSDKTYLIDLQIMYNDESFTDNRSGFSFAPYLVAEADY